MKLTAYTIYYMNVSWQSKFGIHSKPFSFSKYSARGHCFGTSDLNYAVSLVSFYLYKHWILNHMNINERTYSSILSLVKNDIYSSSYRKNTHIVIHLSKSCICKLYM